MIYRIQAERFSREAGIVVYEIEADSKAEAIENCKNGDGEEVDWFVNCSEVIEEYNYQIINEEQS